MGFVKFDELGARDHSLHLGVEVEPIGATKVVGDQKAPLEEVVSEPFDLGFRRIPKPGFGNVRKWEAGQCRVVRNKDIPAIHIRLEVSRLTKDVHEVQFRPGVVMSPWRQSSAPPASEVPVERYPETDTCEREVAVVWHVRFLDTAGPISRVDPGMSDMSGRDRPGEH